MKNICIGELDGWKFTKIDGKAIFQRRVTLTGSAQNIDLPFSHGVQLNRIETYANDATAKSYSIRMFAGLYENYAELQTLTSDTEQSNVLQLGSEYAYTSAQKLRFAITASTAGKTLDISVAVEDL